MKYLEISLFTLLTFGVSVHSLETVHDAAKIARNLVDHSVYSVGSMATVSPPDDPRLPAQPFSLPEYYASCHQNGTLTLLFLPISRNSRNLLRAPGQVATISVASEKPWASQPRVALTGNVTIFRDTASVPNLKHIQRCYLARHPDASRWLPDDPEAPHVSYWALFNPFAIYYVGGFGDEHYIGNIPLELYQNAAASEIEVPMRDHSNGVAQRVLATKQKEKSTLYKFDVNH